MGTFKPKGLKWDREYPVDLFDNFVTPYLIRNYFVRFLTSNQLEITMFVPWGNGYTNNLAFKQAREILCQLVLTMISKNKFTTILPSAVTGSAIRLSF